MIAAPASIPTGLPPTVSPHTVWPKMVRPPQPKGAKFSQFAGFT
jgi:hypothetical protein